MTILQSDTITGLEYASVKPSSRSRMLKQFEQIAKDQTALYKQITNINAPNTLPAPQAVGHYHAGNNTGAIISIPLVNQVLEVSLDVQIGLSIDEFQASNFIPFYAPFGVTEVRILGVFSSSNASKNFRFQILSDSFSALNISHSLDQDDNSKIKTRVYNVNEDSINILRIEGWFSQQNSYNGDNISGTLKTIVVLPTLRSPNLVQGGTKSKGANSSIFPASNQYSSNRFTSFSDSMFTDDSALSSYILASTSLNDALLSEVLTGQRASSTDTATLTGHNHEQSTTDLDRCGAGVNHSLGSWNYGAGLGINVDQYVPDAVASGYNWRGRCEGISMLSSATSFSTFQRHLFSFTDVLNSKYTSGSSTIDVAIAINLDHAKTGDITVRARIIRADLTNAGTWVQATETGTGRQTVLMQGLDMIPAVVGGKGEYVLELQAKMATGVVKGCVIYGSCLHVR